MKRMAYSFRFFGSKSYQLQQIMEEIELLNKNREYDTFVEVFGGSGRLTFALPNGMFKRKIYNDRDPALCNLLRCMIDDTCREFMRETFIRLPWSRSLFDAMKTANDAFIEMVENEDVADFISKDWAVATYYIHGYSFMGKGNRMGYFIKSWRNVGKENIEVLENFHRNNLEGVQIDWGNYDKALSQYDNSTTIFYLDPPYIRESSIYRYGFTVDDYYKLAEILSGLEGKYIMNISMEDTVDVVEIFGPPTYVIDYHAHAYITDKERPTFGMGFWRNW